MKAGNINLGKLIDILLQIKNNNIDFVDVEVVLDKSRNNNMNKVVIHPIDKDTNKEVLKKEVYQDPKINTEDNNIFNIFEELL